MGLYIGHSDGSLIPSSISDKIGLGKKKAYGVSFDPDTGAATRLFNAAGKQFTRSTPSAAGLDDFKDDNEIWGCRTCKLVWDSSTNKHTVTYKDTQSAEYNAITSNYDICIDFPLFYYKRYDNLGYIVSDSELPGFLPSPMHFRDNHLYKHLYMQKYMAKDSTYHSTGSGGLQVSQTISTFRTKFKTFGMYVCDMAARMSINMLMMIKYASLDSQNTIGFGWTLSSHTGQCSASVTADNVLGLDGGSNTNATNQEQAVVSLGLENWWGNLWEFTDGFVHMNAQPYYSNSLTQAYPSSDASSLGTYKKVTSKISTTNNNRYGNGGGDMYATKMSFDATYPELFFPTQSGYIDSTWESHRDHVHEYSIYKDGFYYQPGEMRLALSGGDWNNGCLAGFLSLGFNNALGLSGVGLGGRAFVNTD